MKNKILFAIFTSVILCSFVKTSEPEFLFLDSNQLKPLGIEINENGVFYKNYNPDWKQDNNANPCLSFYCGDDNYLTTRHYSGEEPMEIISRNDSILDQLEITRNDFYPLLIGNTKREQSLNKPLSNNTELLPVAVCMSDAKSTNRNDTIVIWFKYTETLRKALPNNTNVGYYLITVQN